MKSYTPKEIIDIFIAHGFKLVRTKVSHHIFVNKKTGKRTTVPVYGKDIKKGTLHGILKQAAIDLKD